MADEPTQTKLQTYSTALYEKMFAESTTDGETGLIVWRGHITKLSRDIGLPDGTYRRVIDALVSIDCIEQIERGFRGTALSVFILHRAPIPEVWAEREPGREGLTKAPVSAILLRRVEDLERRFAGIDVAKALIELQEQLDGIKSRLDNINSNTQGEIS